MNMSIPDSSIDGFSSRLSANSRRNARMIILDGVFFGFGYAAFSPFTILPGFIRHFTSNPVVINSIVSIYMFGLFGTQLFSCWLYDSRPAKRGAMLLWSGLFRAAMLPLITIAFFSRLLGSATLPLFFIFYIVAMVSWGMSALLWHEMIGRWLDEKTRSVIVGVRFFSEQLITIAGSFVVILLMEKFVFPGNYTLVFLAGALFWWVCHVALSFTREAVYPIVNDRLSIGRFAAEMIGIIRSDRSFRSCMVALAFSSAHTMSMALYTTASMDRFLATASDMLRDQYAGQCNLVLSISVSIGALVSGYVSLYFGNRAGLIGGFVLSIAAAVNAFLSATKTFFMLTFIFNGLAIGAFMVCTINILLLFSPVQKRLRYIAIANTARGFSATAFPLAGGIVMNLMGPAITYSATAVFGLIGLLVLIFGVDRTADGIKL